MFKRSCENGLVSLSLSCGSRIFRHLESYKFFVGFSIHYLSNDGFFTDQCFSLLPSTSLTVPNFFLKGMNMKMLRRNKLFRSLLSGLAKRLSVSTTYEYIIILESLMVIKKNQLQFRLMEGNYEGFGLKRIKL